MNLADPSRFWGRLGLDHADALSRQGFEKVKRVQALRYFTWRWRPSQLARSEQLRFLLRHSRVSDWVAALDKPLGATGEEWADLNWSPGERFASVIATRLLWRYASRHGDPLVMALSEPELGKPLPIALGGRLISQDLANAALETGTITRALNGREPERIVEIGGGYGRTAYALLHRFPRATYTIIDIEPAASIARWYLDTLLPGRVEVLDPEAATRLADASFDLGVSISSLQEMRLDQIAGYLALLDRVCRGGTVYLKQWSSWRNPVDDVIAQFDDYPIAPAWRQVLRERCPIQTKFTQAAWALPG